MTFRPYRDAAENPYMLVRLWDEHNKIRTSSCMANLVLHMILNGKENSCNRMLKSPEEKNDHDDGLGGGRKRRHEDNHSPCTLCGATTKVMPLG